jgi:lipooligosaccharide transport system permease protein
MLSGISLFGLVSYPSALLILPLSFLGGIAFGSLGMVFTGKVKTIDLFNLPIFLFITPMYLFSGTFFPLEALPSWARLLAYTLPLTHLVDMTRSLGAGRVDASCSGGPLSFPVLRRLFPPCRRRHAQAADSMIREQAPARLKGLPRETAIARRPVRRRP